MAGTTSGAATVPVERDRHGLYVRVDGFLFRPQVSAPAAANARLGVRSILTAGRRVAAVRLGGSACARVGGEMWFSHGRCVVPSGTGTRSLVSTACWDPAR